MRLNYNDILDKIPPHLPFKGREFPSLEKRGKGRFSRKCQIIVETQKTISTWMQMKGFSSSHKCREKGNLVTLKRHLGDWEPTYNYDRKQNSHRKPVEGIQKAFSEKVKAYALPDEKKVIEAHERLLHDAEALAYVTDTRRISLDAVKHFKLGLQTDGDGTRWLTIPHYEKGS